MKHRHIAAIFSVILILLSFVSFFVKGLNFGVDFTGGVDIQLKLGNTRSDISTVREALTEGGFTQVMIQVYDDGSVSIRYQESDEETQNAIIKAMQDKFATVVVEKIDKVGPIVGHELRRQTMVAVICAILAILIYMAFRFRFRFGVVTAIGLIHDAIIVLGAYSLTGREVGTWFIAAILTVIGYSLNDSIVLLDRVRENWLQLGRLGIVELMDNSINQILSRSIITSLTTLFPVLAMYYLGVEVMANLAFAFLVGIIIGTYSTLFIVSALVVEWYLRKPERR